VTDRSFQVKKKYKTVYVTKFHQILTKSTQFDFLYNVLQLSIILILNIKKKKTERPICVAKSVLEALFFPSGQVKELCVSLRGRKMKDGELGEAGMRW
jgi:hypothetical protein